MGRRFWKTHLPLNYLPFKAYPKRMIICCRNPKDVLVSFYFHFKNFRGKSQRFTGSFDTFYTLFVAGLLNGNSYFDFYRNFWSFYRQNLQSKQTEIYWSNFEDFAESEQSKRRQIRNLIKFIGVDDVVNSEQDLDRIMERTSVKRMKQQYKAFLVADFVRKGMLGIGNII